MQVEIKRVNHFPDIMKQNGWDREEAIRQSMYHARLSWPSAAKWADGETDVDLITLERMAAWLKLGKDDLLETKLK